MLGGDAIDAGQMGVAAAPAAEVRDVFAGVVSGTVIPAGVGAGPPPPPRQGVSGNEPQGATTTRPGEQPSHPAPLGGQSTIMTTILLTLPARSPFVDLAQQRTALDQARKPPPERDRTAVVPRGWSPGSQTPAADRKEQQPPWTFGTEPFGGMPERSPRDRRLLSFSR
jgi:hypothetical protein